MAFISLFDFTFGLGAVVLGLALTHLANSLHRLAMAGKSVKWAPEPVLLSAIIFLVIVSVWLSQWSDRRLAETTIGLMLLQVIKLLLLYLAAAFVFPGDIPRNGEVDLFAHYERTRVFTFGALIVGLLLFWLDVILAKTTTGTPVTIREALTHGPWIFVSIYLLLIFVRVRSVNILLLAGGFLYYAWEIVGVSLKQRTIVCRNVRFPPKADIT